MSITAPILSAALMVVQTSATPAPVPGPLTPAGPWTLVPEPLQCLVTRKFGTATGERTLGLMSKGGSAANTLVVIDETAKPSGSRMFPVTLTVDGRTRPVEGVAESRGLRNSTARLTRIPVDEATLKELAAARSISVSGKEFSAEFSAISMTKAYAAFTSCNRNILARLGVDLALRDAAVTLPEPIQESVKIEYPPWARFAGETGGTGVLVSVDPAGLPTGCRVVASSKSSTLDDATCKIFTKARFRPARDKDGSAIRSEFMTTLNWALHD